MTKRERRQPTKRELEQITSSKPVLKRFPLVQYLRPLLDRGEAKHGKESGVYRQRR